MNHDRRTIAEDLAAYAAGLRDRPAEVAGEDAGHAAQRLLDNLGCMTFGLSVKPARAIAELAASMGTGTAHVLGSPRTSSPTAAAFAHGTLAQSFELNDLGVYVHPGACVVPAALAALDAGEREVRGAEFIAALVAGYEITVRVSECIGPSPELDIGWHTPPFHGAIGAAASAAMLLGLDAAHMAQALVIAADLAGGGLMLARLGSDVKRVHCGRGAETGMLAALLAQRGLRSRLDTFEHPDWGYCRTMVGRAGAVDPRAILDGLGRNTVAFRRTAVKYYPVGAEVLGVIDTIARLKREHGIAAADVERVEVGTPAFFVKAEGHEFPDRDAQIHFNTEYGAAMALAHDVRPVYEDPSILRYWLQGYRDEAVRQLAARVRHVVDPELDRKNPYGIDSTVAITLKSGRVVQNRTAYVDRAESTGTMQFAAMTPDRILAKFKALTAEALTPGQQESLAGTVLGLAGERDARALWRVFGTT